MSKLLERLSDPARSGVYRVRHAEDVRDCLRGAPLDFAEATLPAGKDAMLSAIARALAFPDGFGANWDALEDCLADLSWRKGAGHVILFTGADDAALRGADAGVLCEVLATVAEYWRERRRPFIAVFVDPQARLSLPALYRERVAR